MHAAQTSTLPVLLHRNGGGLIALCRKPGPQGERFWQRHQPLHKLLKALPPVGTGGDFYVSANSFSRPTRALSSLHSIRAAYVDLDFYKLPRWSEVSPEAVWSAAKERLAHSCVRQPQAVIFTGRGLQLVWALGVLPAACLPRWRAVQRGLAQLLLEFGADMAASDAARVLRLPGTINSKSGRLAAFLELDLEQRTDFELLAAAILPVSREKLRRSKITQRALCGSRSFGPGVRAANARTILSDMERLIWYRWGGRVPEGQRNTCLFAYGCFLVHVTGRQHLEAKLQDFASSVTDLPQDEVARIAFSISAKVQATSKGYRFSNWGAASFLGVTVREAEAAGLQELLPAEVLLPRRKATKQERDRERRRRLRVEAGSQPHKSSRTRTQPWTALGLSRSTWYRRYGRQVETD